ncbi:MAG: epoxyqueuosine reductase [Candidatus Aminicenantes bacterium]|nr:epoxyqueuosine reductase [Candidatus Aminicenantes bacterium]
MSQKRITYENIRIFFAAYDIDTYGLADLSGVASLTDSQGNSLSRAFSFAVPMNPKIMAGIKKGPNRRYAHEYTRVNRKIDSVSEALASYLGNSGFFAKAIPASERTDLLNIRGDFPHKTAATLAGLGWIGRNCQLITKKRGPWVRLGTVFTNFPGSHGGNAVGSSSGGTAVGSVFGKPVTKSFCGKCRKCVDACPAGALVGNSWRPGIPREQLLDVWRCDLWKKENYFEYNHGHNCGICAAVCPFGQKD